MEVKLDILLSFTANRPFISIAASNFALHNKELLQKMTDELHTRNHVGVGVGVGVGVCV